MSEYDDGVKDGVFYYPRFDEILIASVDCNENALRMCAFHIGLNIVEYDYDGVEFLGYLESTGDA